MDLPTSDSVLELDDQQLAGLAANWRARAGYGDRAAFGAAQVLEVERRRRLRATQPLATQLQGLLAPPRPKAAWWKFWSKAPERQFDNPDNVASQ
ncbi:MULTISPECIES: hypothetical protein [unclassified Variovorax]|uniref:hypothetical protein n=1 Tax=unclassified Variovorax TaxID=663243 RepID=UPI001BD3E5F6|nr:MULTISPECIES: hypothetical protein [unclassified Variovorax]